jgi:hypothetical protein
MMTNRTVISLLSAGLLMGLAATAHAQTTKRVTDFTVRADTVTNPASGQKSLVWDARQGRWGVTLNLAEPVGRDAKLNDLQAGAYFRVTPTLRIGGAVALGDQAFTPSYKKTEPLNSAPRVRLETAFKF